MSVAVALRFLACVSFALLAPLTWAGLATQPAGAGVKKVSLKEFETLRGDKKSVVLDVRTPQEFAAGHVPGAVNVNWRARDFAERVGKLDKSKQYVLHCLGGVRSAAAGEKMTEMGFEKLFDYSGGWMEYSKSGKPVEK